MDRLQKLIAAAGLCSRREAEEWVRQGRVQVNGHRAALGDRADPASDIILVDNSPLENRPALIYVAMNKPRGVVTSKEDRHADQLVMDLLPPALRHLHPVGRLDRDTEGLLILTNDGELTHRLSHPSFGVNKLYRVDVEGSPDATALEKLQSGVALEEGVTAPARAIVKGKTGSGRHGETVTRVEIELHEGRKRQVRRMFQLIGHPVIRLCRVQYGPLKLGALRPGQWRILSPVEVEGLTNATRRAAPSQPSGTLRKREPSSPRHPS